MRADVILGDCLDVMRGMPAASIDAVVTDPPYGLAFMGKLWDHGVPGEQFWAEALRVAKPGAALLAFGGTRTFHRLACAIEDSGWRIFDCLSWMYGQGFPKHRTHLKPAWEPIVFAAKKGTRFVNVEGCRIGTAPADAEAMARCNTPGSGRFKPDEWASGGWAAKDAPLDTSKGRWPANVLLDEEAARMVDEMSGTLHSGANPTRRGAAKFRNVFSGFTGQEECVPARGEDSGGASRFFYTAKASRADRDEELLRDGGSGALRDGGRTGPRGNHHPTVKPTDLMRWLCRLVTPPGGTVLDPFCGSGSTGVAANAEGFDFVGIEREAEYVEIARRRIANVAPLFSEGGAA